MDRIQTMVSLVNIAAIVWKTKFEYSVHACKEIGMYITICDQTLYSRKEPGSHIQIKFGKIKIEQTCN